MECEVLNGCPCQWLSICWLLCHQQHWSQLQTTQIAKTGLPWRISLLQEISPNHREPDCNHRHWASLSLRQTKADNSFNAPDRMLSLFQWFLIVLDQTFIPDREWQTADQLEAFGKFAGYRDEWMLLPAWSTGQRLPTLQQLCPAHRWSLQLLDITLSLPFHLSAVQ